MGCQCGQSEREIAILASAYMVVAHIIKRDEVHHHERARGARSSSQYRVLTLLLRPESIWRSTLRSIISWLGDAFGAVLAKASY